MHHPKRTSFLYYTVSSACRPRVFQILQNFKGFPNIPISPPSPKQDTQWARRGNNVTDPEKAPCVGVFPGYLRDMGGVWLADISLGGIHGSIERMKKCAGPECQTCLSEGSKIIRPSVSVRCWGPQGLRQREHTPHPQHHRQNSRNSGGGWLGQGCTKGGKGPPSQNLFAAPPPPV